MTPKEKIEYVKRNIDEKVQISPKGPVFVRFYTVTEFEEGPVLITRGEQNLIVRKLEEEGYLKNVTFEDDGTGTWVEVAPNENQENGSAYKTPVIKLRTLELISQEIGSMGTGSDIINLLVNCGVDRSLINYPQTKWRMVYEVLQSLSLSINPTDHKLLFYIIEEAVHPLMHGGNETNAKQYVEKFNNLLKYDGLVIIKGKINQIGNLTDQDNGREDQDEDEEDVFSYDGGISSLYENTELELFILKKILLEYKRRDDAGFMAKELSFNNNSLMEICRVINRMMEDKILYLSANTRPERFDAVPGFEDKEGIEAKDGFINWKLAERLDKNPQELDVDDGCVIFDIDVIDEVKLKGRIDIAIEEFMNDQIYDEFGYLVNKDCISGSSSKNITYPYVKQREIVIEEFLAKNNEKDEMVFQLNYSKDKKVEVLKTLLALEKENLLRIKELGGNPMFDEKGNFLGKWSTKDNPFAKVQPLKPYSKKQEPIPVRIEGLKEGFEALVKTGKKSDAPKFPYKIPAGTKWEDFIIKILDDENMLIKVKRLEHTASYKELGLTGRDDNPRKAVLWGFLNVLSKLNGELKINDPEAKDKYKKQKELLGKALQSYFSIDYDPFYPYRSSLEKSGDSYKIKITLIPLPD